jgi:hypothetical protein
MLFKTLALSGLAAAAVLVPAAAMAQGSWRGWERRDHAHFDRGFYPAPYGWSRPYVFHRPHGPYGYVPRPFYGWR